METNAVTLTLLPRGGRAWVESPPSKETPFIEWPWLVLGLVLVTIKVVVMTSKTPVWLRLKKEDDDG